MNVDTFFDIVVHERDFVPSAQYIERYFTAQEITDKSVIDAGCGSGIDCFVFASKGAHPVVGIDISQTSINMARKNPLASQCKDVSFICTSIEEYFQVEEKTVDIIFCQGSLLYLTAGDQILDLVCKRLKRKGIIFFTVAADTWLAHVINSGRKVLNKFPRVLWNGVTTVCAALITVVRKCWGGALKERGTSLSSSMRVTLFYPFASLFKRSRIMHILQKNGINVTTWETHRVLHQELFYVVKAVKS